MKFSLLLSILMVCSSVCSRVMAAQALDAEVTFNLPGLTGGATSTIEDKLVEMTNMATPGSKIRIVLYTFIRTPLATALLQASSRGVDVRVVLDGSNHADINHAGTAVQMLVDGVRGVGELTCSEKPCLKFCEGPFFGVRIAHQIFGGACHGLVINHNKFFLFSHLSNGDSNIVAQTSANLEDAQMHLYNDLVIFKNDEAFFKGYDSYWEDLIPNRIRLTAFPDAVGDAPVVTKFFPRLLTGRDPILLMLDRVRCNVPGSMIRITGPNFTRKDVAERLVTLRAQGCDVKVIADYETSMWSPSKSVISQIGDFMLILPYAGSTPAQRSSNAVHSKLVLIDAPLDGASTRTAVVMTGSHNLDFFSLRTNDETLVEIFDRPLFNQYIGYWNAIDTAAHGIGVYAPDEKPNLLISQQR